MVFVRYFSRHRKVKWVFVFCVFLFLVSLSSAWFSFAGQFLGLIFRLLLVVLNSDVYVFMVFNAMIFLVYSLSGLEKRTESKLDTSRNDGGERSRGITAVGEFREPLENPADDSVVEKRIVLDSNVVFLVDKVPIAAILEEGGPISPIVSPTKMYRRTESERYEHRETNKLRRSNTDISRELISSPTDDSVVKKRTESDGNVVYPINELAIAAISEEEKPISPIPNPNSMTEIISQTKQYRRAESERYEHPAANRLWRTNTDIRRESVTTATGDEPARLSCSVNELDIDDFNRTVESFIAEKKSLQWEEFREEQIANKTHLGFKITEI